jgi:hypothetical protein
MFIVNKDEVLIPYCKFQDGYPPKWGYADSSGKLYSDLIYGYCSLFRGDFSIYGQYHYQSRDKNLVFGVINKKLEYVENIIYSALEFYPQSSTCFIGMLNTNTRLNLMFPARVFFNLENGFSIYGNEIIPINKKYFALNNIDVDLKIYTIQGDLLCTLPFFIDYSGNSTEAGRDSFQFYKLLNFGDKGFSLDFFKTNREYLQGNELWDDFETYSEAHFQFEFNNNCELVKKGNDLNDKIENKFDDCDWFSDELNGISFTGVQQELFESKLISSDKVFSNFFYGAKVYQSKSGTKYWQPKMEDYSTIYKL